MPRKKKPPLTFVEEMARLKSAGLKEDTSPNRPINTDIDGLPTLEERLKILFDIAKKTKHDPSRMLFFVMYDIESNKVRRHVVKYLERQGCSRIQKSIFLADLPVAKYEQIRNDLVEVQGCYENEDSILVVPISSDMLNAMKIIGQNINIDLITRNTTTLFF
jgi:CRISPR-associated protein Cas2